MAGSLATRVQIEPRIGPKGIVLSPPGGTVVVQGEDTLQFVYEPLVQGSFPGIATSYLDLYIWNELTDETTPLAIGLTATEEEQNGILDGLITATFSFASGGVCGDYLQLVVYEYQTGWEAPAYGFQSAAPYFSVVDCHVDGSQVQPEGDNSVVWFSPLEGATVGEYGDPLLLAAWTLHGYSFNPRSIDIDVQQNLYLGESDGDQGEWKPVVRRLNTYMDFDYGAFGGYFLPTHWGYLGDLRLRAMVYNEVDGDWTSYIGYLNFTVIYGYIQ
ncbi:hypothetical protein DACRYDRAFT_107909 [Dacryopinax primogenitus]|uniref:Uncharacterized protein n=1 Tax=Dacryopinax primogenitus (strain DJM 731) TaxID=1858805 RepID=M5FUE6_DACPD|nr:uncharacterized protein DACRYDRAFT_107909 [Dacryopinax primogenitus]EJU01356.1 hypothetical protein DACRYDRAFT_107909 [Dacryopinax primogenitus]